MDAPENRKKLLNLLKTTRGQIDAIINMVDDTKQCSDILVQLLSAQGLMKKCTVLVLENRIKDCLNEAVKNSEERENKIDEIVSILSKLSKA
ncbi:MAG: metal-sensing transcriptional repressor [Ruminiclostridium sp.]|nr:metal-sensing transcriptional repressor [Ruminiclostridium sp.]